ncbi:uncharacterized protein [Anabrus simplex]|uniref:uncharacterized protein n=1 Tax=Anabrus simplex TaxID=316456 RepID=UPI0034DCF57C
MDNTQNTEPKEKTEQEPLWVPETEQYRQWIAAQEAKKKPAPRACIAAVIIFTIMAAFVIMIFLLKTRDIEDFEIDEAGNSTDILLGAPYNDTGNQPVLNGGSNVFIPQ